MGFEIAGVQFRRRARAEKSRYVTAWLCSAICVLASSLLLGISPRHRSLKVIVISLYLRSVAAGFMRHLESLSVPFLRVSLFVLIRLQFTGLFWPLEGRLLCLPTRGETEP